MEIFDHLEKLKYFQRLSDFSSLNEAAKSLGISQGGLSKNILILEQTLNLKLLIRGTKGITLTSEGEIVAKMAKEIGAILKKFEGEMTPKKMMTTPDIIRVGIYDSFAVYFYPELSEYMRQIFPQVEIELIVDRSQILEEKLFNGHLDLVMGAQFKNDSNVLRRFILIEDSFSFYVKNPLKDHFSHLPLLTNLKNLDKFFQDLDKSTKKILETWTCHEVTNFETIKSLTIAGLGIAVIPSLVARPLVKSNMISQIQLPKSKGSFAKHSVEMLVRDKIFEKYELFINEILGFSKKWSRGYF